MSYLQPCEWEAGMAYRYLRADKVFIEDQYHPEFQRNKSNPDITVHSWDLSVSYGVTKRFSVSLDLPFTYGEATVITNRLHMVAGGLGDLRLVGNLWVLDPPKHPDGNVALGLGAKSAHG